MITDPDDLVNPAPTSDTAVARCPGVATARGTLSFTCAMLQIVVIVFDAELWIWDARRNDSWTFVSLPVDASEDIRQVTGGERRGFGSLRVRVTVGTSTWTTSIFPDSANDCYVLPIKRAIRNAEGLDAGDTTTITVELIDA
jgi:hypothetical protein